VTLTLGTEEANARVWRVFPTTRELIEDAKRIVPRCLTRAQRVAASLDPTPPSWCIELEKWPYDTQDWKNWLKHRRAGANPPLPDTAK
jgi:hypothetical protein